ncbi:MAG: hypothetical protein WCO66_02875 [Candidatus Absconditabacteria bacterium]
MEQTLVNQVIEKIKASQYQSNIARRILIWLIAKSENFTKPVVVSIYTTDNGKMFIFDEIAEETQKLVEEIDTCDDENNVSNLLKQIQEGENKMIISQHSGIFFEHNKARAFVADAIAGVNNNYHTIWIAPEVYDRNAEVIEFDLNEIEKVEL